MFSQTVEYALRAMTCLATLGGAVVSSATVADQTRVPPSGFVPARTPGSITILDVINALDPIRRINRCPAEHQRHAELCTMYPRLDSALASVEQTFQTTTLAEVIESGNDCVDAVMMPIRIGPRHGVVS